MARDNDDTIVVVVNAEFDCAWVVVAVVDLLFALSAVDGEKDDVFVVATGSAAGYNDRVVSIAVSFVDEGDDDEDGEAVVVVVVVDAKRRNTEFDCD